MCGKASNVHAGWGGVGRGWKERARGGSASACMPAAHGRWGSLPAVVGKSARALLATEASQGSQCSECLNACLNALSLPGWYGRWGWQIAAGQAAWQKAREVCVVCVYAWWRADMGKRKKRVVREAGG